jgi:hypothetical protein
VWVEITSASAPHVHAPRVAAANSDLDARGTREVT